MSFSRRQDVERKPLTLQPLIKETLKLLRSIIPSDIQIEYSIYQGNDVVLADTVEIHEINMDLCTNAYHAMEETGGTLTTGLDSVRRDSGSGRTDRDYCCITVKDTGTGIAGKDLI